MYSVALFIACECFCILELPTVTKGGRGKKGTKRSTAAEKKEEKEESEPGPSEGTCMQVLDHTSLVLICPAFVYINT